jgi:predicted RND superfamily exporter protein
VDALEVLREDPLREKLRQWVDNPMYSPPSTDGGGGGGSGDRRLNQGNSCPEQGNRDTVTLFYEATDGGSMLDEGTLLSFCRFERQQLLKVKEYTQKCLKYRPCLCGSDYGAMTTTEAAVAQVCASHAEGQSCENIFNPDGTNAISLTHPLLGVFTSDTSQCELAPTWQSELRKLADVHSNFDVQTARAQEQRVKFIFDKDFAASYNATGALTSKYMRTRLAFQADDDWLENTLYPAMLEPDSPAIRVYFNDPNAMQRQMNKDMLLAGISFVVVFVYMWFNTRSVFITTFGMLSILLSFPLAFFVWRVVLQQKFFGTLMMMSLFIILGIGADDVFVLQDAWKQSAAQPAHISATRETRFAWAYRRAANAMLTTSFTTFMAFVSTAMTPVPAIKSFGIFAAFVVLFTFLLVITFFSAAVMFHDKHFVQDKGPYACGHELPIGNYCCGVIGPLAICKQHMHHEGGSSADSAGGAEGGMPLPGKAPELKRQKSVFIQVEELEPVPKKLFLWSPHLQTYRWPIILAFLALFIGMGFMALLELKPAHTLGDFFPTDHPVTRLAHISESGFAASSTDKKFEIAMVWGMVLEAPIDRAGTDMNDPKQLGTVQFDVSWSGRQEQMQTEMALACDAIATYEPVHTGGKLLVASHINASSTLPDDLAPRVPEMYCPMRELREYLRAKNRTFPLPEGSALANEVSSRANGGFRNWQRERAAASYAAGEPMAERFESDLNIGGFVLSDDQTRVIAMSAAFNSTIPWSRDPPTDVLKLHFDDWGRFMAQNQLEAFFVNRAFSWLTTVTALNESAQTGILYSLALCALVLLISTGNLYVSVMAMSSIVGIMITVFGMMACLGWKISMLESICMIVVVGMAVDYTVHLMHSYNEAKARTRFRKAQCALTEMGVSVISGALTTFAASVPLLFAEFKFFTNFGTFIAMITVASILWSVVFLMTLAMACGPEGSEEDGGMKGDIAFFKFTLCGRKRPVMSLAASDSQRLADGGGGGGGGGAGEQGLEMPEIAVEKELAMHSTNADLQTQLATQI